MKSILKRPLSFAKALLDVVLPPVCYVCRKSCTSAYGLCDNCFGRVKRIYPPCCPRCGKRVSMSEKACADCKKNMPLTEKGWASCYYEDTIRECIHLFKYGHYLGLRDVFRDIMVDFARKNRIDSHVNVIVPVPIHGAKKRERSYNHAEILARPLAQALSLPLDVRNLKKIKWTVPQSELDKNERMQNVKNAFFVVDKKAFSGKNVLIIDDIYTTGATITECTKALLEANACRVYSYTLARGK